MRAGALLLLALFCGGAEATVAELLAEARAQVAALDYDAALRSLRPIAEREASGEERLEAAQLEGSCLAILGRIVEAEKPFRLLLRARPDFDLPASTSPRILTVLRKVQVEERALAAQIAEVEHQRLLSNLRLEGRGLKEARGGLPIDLVFQLTDPTNAVSDINLLFRRSGEQAYSSVPLVRGVDGSWATQLTGEWTSNPSGFVLQYQAETKNSQGRSLLKLGSSEAPLQLRVDAGQLEQPVEIYESPWFWVIASAVLVTASATSYLLYRRASDLPEGDLTPFTTP